MLVYPPNYRAYPADPTNRRSWNGNTAPTDAQIPVYVAAENQIDWKSLSAFGLFPSGVLTRFVYGLGLAFVSNTSLSVNSGSCRDSADAGFLSLSSQQTIAIHTQGALGNDSFTGPGLVSTTGATSTVTGAGTTFTTSFGTRAMTGTISSSSTTVTGTNTLFLSQIAVGDLIGTAAKGYFRVTAIASNTSLTISTTPGSAFSGQTPNAIENPTIQLPNGGNFRVDAIASDTSLTVVSTPASNTSQAYVIGVIGGQGSLLQIFFNAWIALGTSGTTVYVSTQRTTPFGLSGYTTSVRRIGALMVDTSVTEHILPFQQSGNSSSRWVQYAYAQAANNSRQSPSGSTSWTDIVGSAIAPPTATQLMVGFSINPATAGNRLSWRPRNAGGPATTSSCSNVLGQVVGVFCRTFAAAGCDGAQGLQWVTDSASDSPIFDFTGYMEQL